jgi:hypothetical protein
MCATGALISDFRQIRQRRAKMAKQNGLRWLPAMLLVLILYPAFARQANAQVDTTYNIGDIVEFQSVSEPNVWMKGKIASKCIGDTCGVLKWNAYTNDWMDGSIYTYPRNIRRPGGHQSALPQQAPPQASANAQVTTTYRSATGSTHWSAPQRSAGNTLAENGSRARSSK